jgi:hypothetical protein
MPEPKKTIVFFEGDDDKAFLEKLQEADLLPPGWQLANRDKSQHAGKDGLVRQLLPVVIVGRLVQKGIQTLGKDGFTALTKPFLDDLAAADELLNA